MRIKVGGYYAYNVSNDLKIKENMPHAYVVQVTRSRKPGLFGEPIYDCVAIDSGVTFTAKKEDLVPTDPVNVQQYVRYPKECPLVVKNDVITLNKAIAELKKKDPNSLLLADMIALSYKLSFYLTVDEVKEVNQTML